MRFFKGCLSSVLTVFFLIFFALYAVDEPTKAKAAVIIMILGTILGVVVILKQKK